MRKATQIVFVRGTGRCGSKTLANQLGLHRQIDKVTANECLPEELMDFNDHHVGTRCVGATNNALVSVCRAYFDAYCSKSTHNNDIVLHKGTMNAHRLASLLEYWPNTKIIYLVRHPIGVVPALIRADIRQFKGAHGHANVANSLLRWTNDVLAYLRSAAFNHPNLLQVKFEDMISDTDVFFTRIYQFLEIDDTFQHDLPAPKQYDDAFLLNNNERQWIIESTKEIVGKLGYSPDVYATDIDQETESHITNHRDRRLTVKPPAIDGVELVRIALAKAASQGFKRVAQFGAGYFSRLIGPHLKNMPIEIICFLDENPSLAGSVLAGLPIHHPQQATRLGVETVIPITLIHQQSLIDKCIACMNPASRS